MNNKDILNMIEQMKDNGNTPTYILYRVTQALEVSSHVHTSDTIDMSGVSIQEYSKAVDKATLLIKEALNKNKGINDNY